MKRANFIRFDSSRVGCHLVLGFILSVLYKLVTVWWMANKWSFFFIIAFHKLATLETRLTYQVSVQVLDDESWGKNTSGPSRAAFFSRAAQKRKKMIIVKMWLKNMIHRKIWLPHMIGHPPNTFHVVPYEGTRRSHTSSTVHMPNTTVIMTTSRIFEFRTPKGRGLAKCDCM
jgi:hypothetical protein